MKLKKTPNPELIDSDNPEWTESDFKHAVPFSEMFPLLVNKAKVTKTQKTKPRQLKAA